MQNLALALVLAFVGGVGALLSLDMPRITRADGYVVNDHPIAKIHAPQYGVLVGLRVKEGSVVQKGTAVAQSVDQQQVRFAEQKKAMLLAEIEVLSPLEKAALTSAAIKQRALEVALTSLGQEIRLMQIRQTELSHQALRQVQLHSQGFVSTEALENKNNEAQLQQLSLQALQRNQIQLKGEQESHIQETQQLKWRSIAQQSQLRRELVRNEQEINEYAMKKQQVIAPVDGMVTQIEVAIGQVVRAEVPLFTLVPHNSVPEVLLRVPSKGIGFVKKGQRVSVRYQAYPHQHYGRHYGMVKEISKVASPAEDLSHHIPIAEPVFTVRVSLPSDHLQSTDKRWPIGLGMLVEADIELDRLKIYQWLLEPLYRLGGRV
jgi:membrane fusion protein